MAEELGSSGPSESLLGTILRCRWGRSALASLPVHSSSPEPPGVRLGLILPSPAGLWMLAPWSWGLRTNLSNKPETVELKMKKIQRIEAIINWKFE